MTTWADIKLGTLKKMFAANGNTIPTDASTTDYLAAMPDAANEALQMLATAGKFIIKATDIAHTPVDNIISNGERIDWSMGGYMNYEAKGAKSLTFAYCGEISYTVYVEDTVVLEDNLSSKKGYSVVKLLVNNPDKLNVKLEIYGDYPYSIKDIGMYAATFAVEEDIPPYSQNIRYDLKKLVDDFYMLSDEGIIFEGDLKNRYFTTDEYLVEGGHVLLLDRNAKGNFKVYYKAYPQQITGDTPDEMELSLDPEVATLLPLYMASQLYKDDDIGVATTYRNEFEVAFERLTNAPKGPSSEHFKSESGWL